MAAPEPKAWLRGHRAAVSSTVFLNGLNESLISGDVEGTVLIWSLQARRVSKAFPESHPGGVLSLSASNIDGRWISQGRTDGSLKVWVGEDLVDVVRTESEGFCRAAIRWDMGGENYTVACATSEESVLAVWNSKTRKAQNFLRPASSEEEKWGMVMDVSLVSFHDSWYAVAVYEDGFLRTFDVAQCKMIPELTCCVQQDKNPATSFALSQVDGFGIVRGVCGGASANLSAFRINLNTFEAQPSEFFPSFHLSGKDQSDEESRLGRGTGQLALRPDERIFAIASWDHRVRIAHFRTCKHLAVLKGHRESVQTVCFSNDSSLLASGSKDQNIAIWSICPPDS
jgi:WD40 repeat protein